MLNTKMIGNKIAEARKKINMSQAQLAQLLFISPQAVGKWERGESMPDIITLNRLAEILGVDLNYFSEGIEHNATEITPITFSEKQSAESSSGKAGKKPGWDMSRGNWVDADFSGLKNLHEKFSSSNMQRCKFNGSDLAGLLLKGNNLDSCDFSGSDISKSRIQGSNLFNNIFKDCFLKETEFLASNIESCDFSGATFNGTEFSASYIYGCDFTGADFSGVVVKSGGFTGVAGKSGGVDKNTIVNAVWNRTSFIDTQIADIVFTGILEDCSYENCAFTRVTFRNATLINTFFKNKSLKRIKFIDCQADRMTYEFLKNGKADLTGIMLLMP
jgi:uncharacterized protein YjbI with pentapeptide repeats